MNQEKVAFGFFVILALSLNFGFVMGDIDNPAHHNVYELFAAIVVSLIATVLKFGDRTQVGAVMLATSLVADLGLVAAAIAWGYSVNVAADAAAPEAVASVVALAGGAVIANVISVVLLIIETVMLRR
jgi:hypothetical protein